MSVVDIYLKAHNEASAAIKAVDADLAKMGGGALNTSAILKTLGSAAVIGAVAKVGQVALDTVLSLDAMREESEQINARFIAQAGSTRNAADALSAMNAVVGAALTNDEKMAASGQLMALGLAQSSTEAANLANIAVSLGDKTQGAAARIEGLTQIMVSGRLRGLTQYGISMQEVTALAADMQRETAGMSDNQAKQNAILEIGTQKLNAYTVAGGAAVTKTQELANAWADYQDALANNVDVGKAKTGIADILQGATVRLKIDATEPLDQIAGLEARLRELQEVRDDFTQTSFFRVFFGTGPSAAEEITRITTEIRELKGELSEESRWAAGAERLSEAAQTAKGDVTGVGDAIEALRAKAESITVNTIAMAYFRAETESTKTSMQQLGAIMGATSLGFVQGPVEQGLDPSGVGRGIDAGAERIKAQQVVDETLEGYRLRQQEAERLAGVNVSAADATQSAWESAFSAIASAAESEFSQAQDQLKGLLPGLDTGGLGSNKPGSNGPFEDLFRAADVANLGGASPWAAQIAAQLGVSNEEVQAKAKETVTAFAQGFRTPEVRKLIDEAMLVDQVKQQEAAKASLDSWGKEIAKAAGVNPNLKSGGAAVFDATFGADKKTGKNEAAEAAAANASTLMVDALGSKLKDEAGRAIGFGNTIWANIETGLVDAAGKSGGLRAAVSAMVAEFLAGGGGGAPTGTGSGVNGAGNASGVKL